MSSGYRRACPNPPSRATEDPRYTGDTTWSVAYVTNSTSVSTRASYIRASKNNHKRSLCNVAMIIIMGTIWPQIIVAQQFYPLTSFARRRFNLWHSKSIFQRLISGLLGSVLSIHDPFSCFHLREKSTGISQSACCFAQLSPKRYDLRRCQSFQK